MTTIQAHGFGISFGPHATIPENIQWMPPGKSTITTRSQDGEPKTREIDATEELAERIQGMFKEILERAKKGEGDLPYFDFNHQDGEASAHPQEFYWAGDDPVTGGIRAKLIWTSAGKSAITGRTFRRFSPEFYVGEDDQVVDLGYNMGGLVNRAAFKRIEPIWSRDGGDPSTNQTKNTNMSKKTVEEQLADLTTALAETNKTVTGIATTMANIQAKMTEGAAAGTQVQAGDPKKILLLETEVATLKESEKVRAGEAAEAWVQTAVREGRIPGQNADLVKSWKEAYIANPVQAKAMLPAPNPALLRITPANGAVTTQSTGNVRDHAFVVKAREFGKAQEIKDDSQAMAQFAGTAEGRELYEDYRRSVRVNAKEVTK